MTKPEQYAVIAIVTVPLAIMLLNKLFYTLHSFLFPCTEDSYRCLEPFLPGFLTLVTTLAIAAFAFYMIFKHKL